MCYHTKFCRSRSNHLDIDREDLQKKFEMLDPTPWVGNVADTLEHATALHVLSYQISLL